MWYHPEMLVRRGLLSLLAAALVLQGVLAVVPHDHGPLCVDGPTFELPDSFDAPHHCLACSVHAPTAAVVAGIAMAWSEIGTAPVVARLPIGVFSAPVESSAPRGPPLVF